MNKPGPALVPPSRRGYGRCVVRWTASEEEIEMGENADAIKERWDDFAKGDLDGAVSITDENAEIRMPETLPWGGTYKGPEGFKEMIQKFLSNFESVDPKPTAFLEADDGETVVVTVEGVGKTKSGNELSGRSVWLYKVRDGRLVDAEFFGDTAQARDALS
jgi:ketosteroid isomerase-like protein